MADDVRKNNNDLTTGDRLYDSGVSTGGTTARDEPQPGDPKAEAVERNYSTYAGEAAESAAKAPPEEI